MNTDSESSLLVSVIIPAKDEANSIGTIIPQINNNLSQYEYEIIVVNDGSRDNTAEVAHNNGAIVLTHKESRGKGAAMCTGGENAKGDILVFLDGDGAHNPEDILDVIAPIQQGWADLVIGSRLLPGSKSSTPPYIRKLTNRLASFLVSIIVSLVLPLVTLFKCRIRWVKITDSQCGFKAVRKQDWQKFKLIAQGFEIESDIIYEAAINGLTIKEVPISCYWDSKNSRLIILRDGFKTLKLLLRKLVKDLGGRKRSDSRAK